MYNSILYSNTGPHIRGHLNPNFGIVVDECVDELEKRCERADELVAVIAMVVVMVRASLNEVSLERC